MRIPTIFRGSTAATAAAPARPASGSVDAADIASYFNFEWATHQEDFTDADTYWWWAVSIRQDPGEVWMEAEDGTLWVIPFETDGTQVTTVGTPSESRLVAVPVTAADGATAAAAVDRRRQRVLGAFHDRPEKPARTTAAERPNHEEEDPMRINIAALRSRLGISASELPDDATEEQVNDVLAADSPEPSDNDDDRPEGSEEPNPPEGEQPEGGTSPPAAAATDRVATVDRDRLAQLERDAAAGAEARRTQLASELDAEVDAAVRDGRITPANREGWRASIDPGTNADEAATARARAERQALAALTPGRVPLTERGTSTTTESASLSRALSAVPTTKRKAA